MSRPPSVSSLAGAPLPPFPEPGKSPYQEHAETYQRLEMTQKRKSQSELELQSLVRIRSTTPNMSPIELSETDQTIWGLRHQIGQMNYQIQELMTKLERQETVIAQQQTTIRNQSKAIENPRGNLKHNVSTTPRHQGAGERQSYLGQARLQGPPPPYGSPYGAYALDGGGQTWPSQYDTSVSTASDVLSTHPMLVPGHSTENVAGFHPVGRQYQTLYGADDFGSPHKPVYPNTPNHQSKLSDTDVNLTTLHGTPSGRAGIGDNDPFGPIAPRGVGRFNARAPVFQPPPIPQQTSHHSESPMSNPYPETSIQPNQSSSTLTLADTLGEQDAAIAEQFDKVFASCKNWALNHANYPNTSGDMALPQELKSRIIRAASMQTAFPLMKSGETRYWLVTKILIQYVIKHILRHNSFAGIDRESDQCIEGLRQTIYQSTPAQLRFVILKNIAEKTQKITDNPKYNEYVEYLIKQRAEKLFWDVRSMKHQATLRDQEDILQLVREAHKLAEMMNTSTNEYSFQWAEIGDRFDRFSMNNICPRYGAASNDEMREKWAMVRLCATPEVVIRKNSADSSHVEEVKLHRMRVLLKVRGDD